MNKKAFTLIELVGVITILGVISILIVPAIIKQIRNNQKKIDKVTQNLIFSATELYIDNKKDEFPIIEDSTYCVSLKKLVEDEKLEEPILDSKGNVIDLEKKVKINIVNDRYEYNIVNICEQIVPSQLVGNYEYTGKIQTFVAPYTGNYKIELWGAQGGSTGGNDTSGVYQTYLGGKGGYSYGIISLSSKQKLYIAVGGQGKGSCVEEICVGGFNGGGNSGVSTEDTKNYTCSGGGASHIALENYGTLNNYESHKAAVLLVAGGGGGGYYHEFGELYSIFGGAGGGLSGVDGELSGYSKDGTNIVKNATGGSQIVGGTGGYRGADGLFGLGGSGNSCNSTDCGSSGGGGGWYGGGAAGHSGTGGGSGYVGDLISGTTIDGTNEIPTYDGMGTMIGNAGNGYAKITFIGLK